MIFAASLATIVALFVLNYLLNGRSLFHPSTAFCAIWAVNLIVIAAAGDFFYSLHAKTLLIFVSGCVSFSVGAALAEMSQTFPAAPTVKARDRLLTVCALIVIFSMPLIYKWLRDITGETDLMSIMTASRIAVLEVYLNNQYPLFTNLFSFSMILSIIVFNERKGHPKLCLAVVLPTLFINFLTGRRMGLIIIVISLFCLNYFQSKKFRWKVAAAAIALVVTIMGPVAIYAGMVAGRGDTFTDNFRPIMGALALYESGGAIVMDRLVVEPNLLESKTFGNFFIDRAQHFGYRAPWHNPSDTFLEIGPGIADNVATIYVGYLVFNSWTIAVLAMVPLGAICATLYRRALAGWPISRILYAFLFSSIVLSPFADQFMADFSVGWRLALVAWLIYPSTKSLIQLAAVEPPLGESLPQ
jgi:oligosaccharide repeat unit polymerase